MQKNGNHTGYTKVHTRHACLLSGVTRGEGRTAPGDTLQGVTPDGKKLWANLQRIVAKRGRTGKKAWGDTLEGVKAIKSDSDSDSDEQKKVARF